MSCGFDQEMARSAAKLWCFVVDIDDHGVAGTVYGVESEDQADDDWLRWAEESELKKIPEH